MRAIGASNYDAPRLAEALEGQRAPRAAALREPAAALQPLRPRRLRGGAGAAVPEGEASASSPTTRWPPASSPASTARRRTSARARAAARHRRSYLNERGLRILAALDEVAARLGATPAQVALAWLIARPSITAPIASATSLAQLEDLIAGDAPQARPRCDHCSTRRAPDPVRRRRGFIATVPSRRACKGPPPVRPVVRRRAIPTSEGRQGRNHECGIPCACCAICRHAS